MYYYKIQCLPYEIKGNKWHYLTWERETGNKKIEEVCVFFKQILRNIVFIVFMWISIRFHE